MLPSDNQEAHLAESSEVESLPRYKVEKPLGSGTYGQVFEVENLSLGRCEALKLLSLDFEAKSFHEEMKRQARFSHPGIVTVFSSGVMKGKHFFTMELLDRSLAALIHDQYPPKPETLAPLDRTARTAPRAPKVPSVIKPVGVKSRRADEAPGEAESPPAAAPVPAPAQPHDRPNGDPAVARTPSRPVNAEWFRKTAKLLLEISEALAYLHKHNTYHCDLKPANVLLSKEGTAKLADFGLAQVVLKANEASPPLGTPRYVSPEAAALYLAQQKRQLSMAQALEPRFLQLCDVYGLGAIMHEMLTGAPPVQLGCDENEILEAVKQGNLRLFEGPNSSVPRRLESLCKRCLEVDPSKRPQSADEVAAELRRYLAPWPVSQLALMAVVMLLLAGVAGLWVSHRTEEQNEIRKLWQDYRRYRDDAEGHPDTISRLDQARFVLVELLKKDEAQKAEITRELVGINMEIGRRHYEKREYGLATEAFRRAEHAAPIDLTGPERRRVQAEIYYWLGYVPWDQEKKGDAALILFNKSLAQWEKQDTDKFASQGRARALGARGDVHLEMGHFDEAWGSYVASDSHRKRLYDQLSESPCPFDQSERPRVALDYAWSRANFASYFALLGQFDKAIALRDEGRRILVRALADLADARSNDRETIRLELAESLLALAEWSMLDRPDGKPSAPNEKEIRAWLRDAERYSIGDKARSLRVRLALAKCKFLLHDNAGVEQSLRDVEEGYSELAFAGKWTPGDFPCLAQVHALLWQLTEDPQRKSYHRISALKCLDLAGKKKYRVVARIEREPVFRDLRDAPAYEAALKRMTQDQGKEPPAAREAPVLSRRVPR